MANAKRDSKMVSFRAPADLYDRLERLRVREDRKLADVVRRLVLKALALTERGR